MNKNLIKKIVLIAPLSMLINTSYAEGFKRFSVSAGWLHIMPQGSANPFFINTAIRNGTVHAVGEITPQSFINSVDQSIPDPRNAEGDPPRIDQLNSLFGLAPPAGSPPGTPAPGVKGSTVDLTGFIDGNSKIIAATTGVVNLNGLEAWTQKGTGLEAEKVDTLGLVIGYHLNDKVSLQMIGGIPPRVDIKGKGKIVAPMSGVVTLTDPRAAQILGETIPIKQDIPITNLGNKPTVSRARAWTPAFEVQYQFGKAGVNKFRPYVAAGVMYAHYNQIKLHHQVRADLVAAGHMIQNIKDGKAGAALDKIASSGNPYVKVKAEDSVAPIATLGFTYDLDESWYATASVSYVKLNNLVKVDVINANDGSRLIRSTSRIDVDPILTYVGVGYRF